MFPTLTWWAPSVRRCLQQQVPQLVRLPAALGALVLEEPPDELQLQVLQPVVVEQLLDLLEAPALLLVDEVGVPDADPLHPGLCRLGAAVAEVEVAPFLALVRLGGARRRPVRAHQLDAVLSGHAHSSLPVPAVGITLISILTPFGSSKNSWRIPTPGTVFWTASMPERSRRAVASA